MMRVLRALQHLVVLGGGAVVAVLMPAPCSAEPSPELQKRIDQAIARGREWMIRADLKVTSGESALIAYSLLKSGLPDTHPTITQAVEVTVQKIRSGVYQKGPEPLHHVYEAGCDAMLLADVDPATYQPELTLLREYLVRKQRPNGSWYYPYATADAGDTSITQFAILGLWALQRSGQEIPQKTWEGAANWLMGTQKSGDGTFVYHPFEQQEANVNTLHSMTTAGTGCLFIIKRMLYPAIIIEDKEEPATQPKKRFGVLELTQTDKPVVERQKPSTPSIPAEALEKAARNGVGWLDKNFFRLDPSRYRVLHYFLYAIERVGTLSGETNLNGMEWYDAGAEVLCKTQTAAGSWEQPNENSTNAIRSTAFSLMFLARATKSIVKPIPKVKLLGGGLQIGGRGLPTDASGDLASKPKKRLGPIDDLLSELEKPRDANVETAQVAVIESVQLQQRDSLIGQVDRLRKLTRHPNPESRSIAYWALGRSGDLRLVPELIRGLDDPDLGVAREASLGLCTLTRLVQGVPKPGQTKDLIPTDPPAGADEFTEPDPEQVAKWRTAARVAWHAWYLQSRPYDERDDQNQIRRK